LAIWLLPLCLGGFDQIRGHPFYEPVERRRHFSVHADATVAQDLLMIDPYNGRLDGRC
jgi:hypothetical protein